jgi:hypothetical protein
MLHHFDAHGVHRQVVNALLTQLDRLKSWSNIVVLTTSNITAAIGMVKGDMSSMLLTYCIDSVVCNFVVYPQGELCIVS